MVRLKLNKLNIVDLTVVVVVFLIIIAGLIYYVHKPAPVQTQLKVTVRIENTEIAKAILPQAEKDKRAYLNSVNSQLTVLGVEQVKNDSDQFTALDITLEGPGYVDHGGDYIFNGQRVLINQKAEIHANYFAQGGIVKIENAN